MQSKKVLLFGKNGQLGSVLTKYLAHYDLKALDYPEVDFNQPDSLSGVVLTFKPSLIINAAAYTAVDQAEEEVDKANNINGIAVGVIAKAAKKLGAGLIHYSTDYIFDGQKTRLYQEDDLPNPINVYGSSKLLGEQQVTQSGVNFLIFRLSWVYSTTHPSFVKSVLAWARKHETLRIVDDQTSNPTWANMVAQKTVEIVRMAEDQFSGFFQEHSGIYNLVGKGAVSRYDWAKAILELDPNKSEQITRKIQRATSEEFNTPAQRPTYSGLDCRKFEHTFNLELPNWKASLAEALSGVE